jgi:signal transduction histidine kinase
MTAKRPRFSTAWITLVPAVGLALLLFPIAPFQKALVFNLVAVGVLAYSALEAWERGRAEPDWRLFWNPFALMLGVVCLLHGALLVQLLQHGTTLPRPPLWWLLGWASFSLVGALIMAARIGWPGRRALRLRTLLDGLIFGGAIFLLLWVFSLRDLLGQALALPEKAGLLLLFGPVALLLGLSAFALGREGGYLKSPLGLLHLLLLGLVVFLAAALKAWMEGNYHQAHPLRMVGLILIPLPILVTRMAWPRAEGTGAPRPRLEDLLPHLPALLALGVFVWDVIRGPGLVDGVGVTLLGATCFLVLVRQSMASLALRRLNQTLETRVAEKSLELAESFDLMVRSQRMNLVATIGAGLAHDVNNLLGTSLLYSQLLAEASTHQNAEDLGKLQLAVTKAGEMTKRLMTFAREAQDTPGLLDLNEHLMGQSHLLGTLLSRTQQFVVIPTLDPLPLRARSTFLDQVLVNLVSNARDATPAGGRISLTLSREAERAVLEVEDTGCGMTPEVQARIFEPFFTTKAAGAGTGLGLSAVKSLVEELGGCMEVRSLAGVGSTFRLTFPLAQRPA